MADKKDTPKDTGNAPIKKSGGSKLGFITVMVVFGMATPFILPTIVLLLLGLIPTIIALITDTDREKSTAISIGALNIAGVLPFVIDLWSHGQTMGMTFQILREPQNWMIMLGAAAVGKLIIFSIPPVLASFSILRIETRIKILKDNLDSLKESWGPDVATTKPIDKIVGGRS